VKRCHRLILGLLGCLLAGALHAQALWPGTTAGMSLEEVRKLFPEAHEADPAAELPAGRGTELLELDQTVIAGHRFTVKFFFKHELLVGVALAETGEIVMKDFEMFRDLLRRKYGLEYSTTSSESIELTWKAVQTVILLKWKPLRPGNATISITYEAPIPKETDRL
jgi:hypothetical protein